MFIKVKINGKTADFILDSGAPSLVLSTRMGAAVIDTLEGKGISGSFSLHQVVVPELELGELKQRQVPAIALDLSHLEKQTRRRIDGLIGYSTLSNYEMLLDYKTKTLTLFLPDATAYHHSIKPTSEMAFELQAHLPVVSVQIGDQTLRLGLDTGAEANLLDLASQTRLRASDYQNGSKIPISGASQRQVTAQTAKVKTTRINGHSYTDMAYVFSDISHFNKGYGLSIDGLLGYPFLSARKMSVNYPQRKIYFWE
jgi:predicted aspartyl protease